jgi:hypothetical protein
MSSSIRRKQEDLSLARAASSSAGPLLRRSRGAFNIVMKSTADTVNKLFNTPAAQEFADKIAAAPATRDMVAALRTPTSSADMGQNLGPNRNQRQVHPAATTPTLGRN